MSLGPGRGFSLRCRWNSSILSSEFRWRLVGWEVKGSVFHIVPGDVMYKQFNDAVMQFLVLKLVSWEFNINFFVFFNVASPDAGQCKWILVYGNYLNIWYMNLFWLDWGVKGRRETDDTFLFLYFIHVVPNFLKMRLF